MFNYLIGWTKKEGERGQERERERASPTPKHFAGVVGSIDYWVTLPTTDQLLHLYCGLDDMTKCNYCSVLFSRQTIEFYAVITVKHCVRLTNYDSCTYVLASSPGPFPAFQCCTLKSGRRAWYAKSREQRHT